MVSEAQPSKNALTAMMASVLQRLVQAPRTAAIDTALADAEHYQQLLSTWDGLTEVYERHRLMLAVVDFVRRAEEALSGTGRAELEDANFIADTLLIQNIPAPESFRPQPVGAAERPLQGHDVASMSVLPLELDRREAAALAEAVLAGRPVRASLATVPIGGELQQVEIRCPDLVEPLMLLGEALSINADGSVLLLLKPIGDFQSAQLYALSDDYDPDAEIVVEPTFDIDDRPSQFPTMIATNAAPTKEQLHSLMDLDEEEKTKVHLGRYQLLERIASGGMATVYLGKVVAVGGFERQVAIKVMHEHIAEDEDFRAMFLEEARLAARIHHPNVVSTLDVQQTKSVTFLVMEYIAGPSLRELFRQTRAQEIRVPLEVSLRVFIDALSGLHAAHELLGPDGGSLSLVHRDVSPHNILVGNDGITRITDFGVARSEARLGATRNTGLKGKLGYMAPEQCLGGGVDRRADVYSAGIVLWEALTGRRLFEADEEIGLIREVLAGARFAPREIDPSIPAQVDDACMKALARDLEDRHASALTFADALEDAARREGVAIATTREVARFVAATREGRQAGPRIGEPLTVTETGTPIELSHHSLSHANTALTAPPSRPRSRGGRTLGVVLVGAFALAAGGWLALRVLGPADAWPRPLGQGPAASAASSASPSSSAGAPVASGAASSSATASPSSSSAAAFDPATPFAGAADEGVGRSAPVLRAEGVVVGLPSGWRQEVAYSSHLILSPEDGSAAVLVVAQDRSGAAPARVGSNDLETLGRHIGFQSESWEPFTATQVGPLRLAAQVAKGAGHATTSSAARSATAVVIEVPERRPVLLIGAWADDTPERQRDFANVVRGLAACEQSGGAGCVPGGQ